MGLRTDHGGKLCRQAVTEEQRTCSSGGGKHPAQKRRGVGPLFSATAHALGVALLIVLVTPGTFGSRIRIPIPVLLLILLPSTSATFTRNKENCSIPQIHYLYKYYLRVQDTISRRHTAFIACKSVRGETSGNMSGLLRRIDKCLGSVFFWSRI